MPPDTTVRYKVARPFANMLIVQYSLLCFELLTFPVARTHTKSESRKSCTYINHCKGLPSLLISHGGRHRYDWTLPSLTKTVVEIL